ncbi:hypothetical protein ZIOFF_044644 [Zingiber officinale]|uniref:Uncharacterized protein n=2 Tax=Zingiber officinale TaxID=94328 RepID=A0A8J5GC65_ZINOF|nr:hypothetical protein ZIOFF_044644 [Zingiber officinale]
MVLVRFTCQCFGRTHDVDMKRPDPRVVLATRAVCDVWRYGATLSFCLGRLLLQDQGRRQAEAVLMGMDPNPRKRESGGTAADEEQRTRRRGEEDPTDEEVEEFFAILRRIREATRHLGARAGAADHGVARPKGRGEGGAPRWQPAFVPEDFEHPGAAESSGDRRERAEKDEGAGKWRTMSPGGERCFDLNEEPADT